MAGPDHRRRRTKAILAVHVAGWPCEMDPILELARRHHLSVIEDCAQAHGATYQGRPVGSFGHVAAFSFCQDKILTTGGEGGMLTTNDRRLWKRAWSYKDHGKDPDALDRPDPARVFQRLHASADTNWRLTEMQAAIGRVMLRRLPGWLQARRGHAALLDERLSRLGALRVPLPPPHVRHSYYKYYAFLRPERLRPGWSRDRIVRADFFFHPKKRVESERRMEQVLHERFARHGLGADHAAELLPEEVFCSAIAVVEMTSARWHQAFRCGEGGDTRTLARHGLSQCRPVDTSAGLPGTLYAGPD